ncbi:GGDEF domain-containing protein, partial [Desulfovibrio sp. OttesenSCG-928-M16]|nr:GGDEF domain-containing protein [Desulfovibrio sp. OttesenSCG-928-M16]
MFTLLKKISLCGHSTDKATDKDSPVFFGAVDSFRRFSGIVVGVLMLTLLFLAVLLNLHEGSVALVPVLVATAVPAALSVLLLCRKEPTTSLLPQMLLCCSMALLGLYLLIVRSAPFGGSLFWFIIYPPMVMFSLGLRLGTAMFTVFFIALSLLLLTPLDVMLAQATPFSERYRFLLALLGTFIFSWCSEYIRHNTQIALNKSLERLEKEACTDPLTGLGNRRDFQASFEWVLAGARRGAKPYSLAMVDIDHFKRVNDIYGHEVGDGMLRHVAHTLSSEMRAADRVFRWGGEEFIVLMPDTSLETAQSAAERMRKNAESKAYTDDSNVIAYTISIGLYCGSGDE